MSFRSSGNLLILHTSFMCVSVCVCVCGTCICTIFWGQDSPIFPSDFQRDPQKMRNHWLALSLSCSSYMGDRWSGRAGTVEMLTPPAPPPAQYLGSSHHSCGGRHVQAPLPEVHKGIITSVFCLDQAIIDFLSKEKQRHTELEGSNKSLFSPPFWALGLAACPITDSHWDWKVIRTLGCVFEGRVDRRRERNGRDTGKWKRNFDSNLLIQESFLWAIP